MGHQQHKRGVGRRCKSIVTDPVTVWSGSSGVRQINQDILRAWSPVITEMGDRSPVYHLGM